MALKPLTIGERRGSQLAKLAELSEQQLSQTYEELKRCPSRLLRAGEIIEMLSTSLGKDTEDVLKLLLSLRRFADDRSTSIDDVYDALLAGLERSGWDAQKVRPLKDRRTQISRILSLDILHSAYKLADLYFAHDRHLHDATIYTEMRPVFDASRTGVDGYVLYSTLRIVSSDRSENEQNFVISLKREEIETLRDECIRALKKLDALERQYKEKNLGAIIEYSGNFSEHD